MRDGGWVQWGANTLFFSSDSNPARDAAGLNNRRNLLKLGQIELARAARQKTPVSCLMIDVDLFKRVNDDHGHAAGDKVLSVIGETIGASIRAHDIAGRYGGEEFVVILPGLNEDDAYAAAERMRSVVASAPVSLADGDAIRITVSVGVACALEGEDLGQLLSRADRALYVAKRSGRNRVVRLDPLMPEAEAPF